MRFVNINDKSPVRLLRQVGSITDEELAEFLATERKFKLRAALRGDRGVDVFDIRRFDGLTDGQRDMAVAFLHKNLPCMAESTLGTAFVVPAQLEESTRMIAELGAQRSITTLVTQDLEAALHWALEQAYDAEGPLDAELVLGGVDAFRFILR